jgi:hypothetical protein
VAKQIAFDPASGDPDWLNHLPETETAVLVEVREEMSMALRFELKGNDDWRILRWPRKPYLS